MVLPLLSVAGPVDASGAVGTNVEAYARQGPYAVRVEREALCCDSDRKPVDVYMPQTSYQRAAPIVVWGNGTWATPDKYDYFLRHLASWGFVVVATRDSSVASGRTMLEALDLLIDAQDAWGLSLDLQRIAAVGHSQGAGGAMNAMTLAGGRIRTAVAIGLPGQQFCRAADCAEIPHTMPPGTTVFFLSGARDGLSPATQKTPTNPPRQSLKAYYDAVPAGRLKLRAAVQNADHNDVQGQPRCGFLAFGCRQGVEGFLDYTTAWLVWRLGIDTRAEPVFNAMDRGSIFGDRRMIEVEADLR